MQVFLMGRAGFEPTGVDAANIVLTREVIPTGRLKWPEFFSEAILAVSAQVRVRTDVARMANLAALEHTHGTITTFMPAKERSR
jgi:hypothetical protein